VSSEGRIFRLSISERRGTRKHNIDSALIWKDYGIVGDAHAGTKKQISLLPFESFDKLQNELLDLKPGDFGENITTIGLNFGAIKVGTILGIGDEVQLSVIEIGKECHRGCRIREITGDCIMPREGVFAKVIKGGIVKVGDDIKLIHNYQISRMGIGS